MYKRQALLLLSSDRAPEGAARLGSLGDPRAVPVLLHVARTDADPAVTEAAVAALSAYPAAIPALSGWLVDREVPARLRADKTVRLFEIQVASQETDAAYLATPGYAEPLTLAHSAPLADLRDALLALEAISVCTQCAARRDLTPDDLLPGASIAGAMGFVEQVMTDGAQALVY